MAQVRFWRGSYQRFKELVKDTGTVYFVTDINEELGVSKAVVGKPYNAIFIGDKVIASSQASDFDMSALEAVIGDLALLEGDLSGKNVVESLNFLQQSIKNIVIPPGGDGEEIAAIKKLIEDIQVDITTINSRLDATDVAITNLGDRITSAEASISSVGDIVGDGVFTSDMLAGKTVTEAVNAIGDVLGNTIEGSIGNLDDIHTDIKGADIVTVINKLDDKVVDLSSFKSPDTPDDYQMASSYNRLTFGEIKGKSAEEILDMMLFPDTRPSVTQRESASLTLQGYSALKEVGFVIDGTLSASFSQGVIGVPNMPTTNRKYKGTPTDYQFAGSGIGATRGISPTYPLNYTILSGLNSWDVTVVYGEGEMPVSAKGTEQPDLRGAAGSSKAVLSITGVYPIYTNKADITNLDSKEALVLDSAKSFDIVFNQANTESNRFKIAVNKGGSRNSIAKIELFNDLNNIFVEQSLGMFTKEDDVVKVVQGIDVTYEVWSCTSTSMGAGSRFRFTFA